ncbi:sensor histidine kinase [Rugosimonospora africana]|nr:HAMP domain-containing sensor histidine kinase [Rugosimonospora africana]
MARTVFGVGLVMLVLLTAIGLWGRQRVYNNQLASSRILAEQEVSEILAGAAASSLSTDEHTVFPYLLLTGENLPFELVNDDGVIMSSSGMLKPFENNDRPLMAAPPPGEPLAPYREEPVTFASRPGNPLSALSVIAVVGTLPGAATDSLKAGARQAGALSPATYRAYVFITPFAAQHARSRFDWLLLAGIPAVAAAVAAAAAWIVRRPLRAVEAIRARAATITGTSLQQRVPVPESRDEIAALAGTINDTLTRLEQSATSQRQFVADAAHELRSPIATMLATVQIARTHRVPDDDPEFFDRIERATGRLQHLTDDLLLLARIDANEPYTFELVELRSIVLAALRPPATLVDGPAVAVRGDTRQLERAIGNLVDNAIRHADSAVTVSVATGGGTARVAVHNDGTPIDPADRERIFQRFVRLDADRARDRGGSGLGLAITREIARRHGGDVTTVPQPSGAEFILELPAAGG